MDNKVGDVVEIGLRSTRIRTIDNTIVIIPNSKLVDNVLLNYAYPENSLAGFFKVGVEYGSPVEKVRKTLLKVAGEIPEIMKDPAPEVQFIEHAESALVFQLLYRVPEYRMRWQVIDKLNTAVSRRFAEERINFAFPTRTILSKLDDVTVQTDNTGDVNEG
jgi:small-conductance mechanosensitive channel